jgi:hypothetical protein
MVVLNLAHGPDDTDQRFAEIKDCVTQDFDRHTPETSPIFLYHEHDLATQFAQELLGKAGDPKQGLWELCQTESIYQRKDRKVHMPRFCAVSCGFKKLHGQWAHKTLEVSIPALDLDMIPNRSLPKVRVTGKKKDTPTSTSRATRTLDGMVMRNVGENAVVASFKVLTALCSATMSPPWSVAVLKGPHSL